ncbi:MAG: DEAD/DEAH box helicase, partial [Clostridiales bacterium]|nr:DEAD/DEAH box helicase [Clostridiales bacterium]
MKTAEVYLLECTPEFDKGYTYKLNFECETGMFVTVPFGKGNKSRTGIVLCVNELPDDEVKYKIKEVIEIDRHYPQLDSEALILAKWMQTRYICSFGDAVRSMLPPASAGRNVKYAMTAIETKTLQGLIESGAVKKEPQIKIIEALIKEEDAISVKDLMQIGNCSISVINTMVKRGYLSLIERKQEDASDDGPHEAYPEHELNREQQEVFTGISELLDRKNFCEVLMQGVTGSGKTEVYMHLISKVLAEGGNAIVLVPEISLTPQMSARFKGRFGNNVAVLHSRLGDRERRKQWEALKEGRVSIVVGARSAVFAPFLHVRLIIIDEEHENTYKSDNTPRFHAAEIARQRCLSSSGVVIYGSATPSVETFYKAISGKINYFKISNRANKCPMPGTVIVDMRQ